MSANIPLCPLGDGDPVQPTKKFCRAHNRAFENVRRDLKKRGTQESRSAWETIFGSRNSAGMPSLQRKVLDDYNRENIDKGLSTEIDRPLDNSQVDQPAQPAPKENRGI